jgi:hypothetical protein
MQYILFCLLLFVFHFFLLYIRLKKIGVDMAKLIGDVVPTYIYIPQDVYNWLVKQKIVEDRSLSKVVVNICRKEMERREKEKAQ